MSETTNSSFLGKRPREEGLPEFIITIKSQDDRSFAYTLSPEKKLRRLFKEYCKKRNLDYETVEFLFDGVRIDPKKTPAELGIEYGDTIDAMTRQHGGGFSI